MTNQSLEERNKKIRERMLNVTEVRFGSFPRDSPWLRPIRMTFIQDGRPKVWDLMRAHESFRPASYLSCLPEKQDVVDLEKYPVSLGLTIELCAGIVDKDKSLVEIAQDEVKEECGYEAPLSAFQKIITYRFISSSSSKQTLFYVEVTDEMNTQPGGGADNEGELIEVIEMNIDEVKKYIASEEVQSPPCFLNGVSWFLTNKKDCYT